MDAEIPVQNHAVRDENIIQVIAIMRRNGKVVERVHRRIVIDGDEVLRSHLDCVQNSKTNDRIC